MPDSQIQVSVSLVEGRPATTSLKIAECFGKEHKNVLADIRNLLAECPEEFGRLNFQPSSYTNEQGKTQPMYIVFFDGFMLLVMGYTGKKALQMKLAYIEAFNAMREKLETKEKPQLAAGPDTPIGPADQNVLQTIVRTKAIALVDASHKGGFPQIWSRFNDHFRLGSYKQLPQSKMADAVEYLVKLEVREKKELPQQQALPPSGDKYEAYMLEVETARGRISEEISRLMDKGIELVDYRKFGPGCLSPYTYALADWLRDVLTRSSPVVDGWRKADNTLNYSPVGIFQKMEKDFEFMKGK